MPGSSDCRCHRQSFHVFLRRQSASHTRLARAHIPTESKRGYIKQVSDMDDSLDVQVVGHVRGSCSSPSELSSAAVTRSVIFCFVAWRNLSGSAFNSSSLCFQVFFHLEKVAARWLAPWISSVKFKTRWYYRKCHLSCGPCALCVFICIRVRRESTILAVLLHWRGECDIKIQKCRCRVYTWTIGPHLMSSPSLRQTTQHTFNSSCSLSTNCSPY